MKIKPRWAATLQQARKRNKITQSALAEILDIPSNSLANYETGFRLPSYGVAVKMCEALNITMYDLFVEPYVVDDIFYPPDECSDKDLKTYPEFKLFLMAVKDMANLISKYTGSRVIISGIGGEYASDIPFNFVIIDSDTVGSAYPVSTKYLFNLEKTLKTKMYKQLASNIIDTIKERDKYLKECMAKYTKDFKTKK